MGRELEGNGVKRVLMTTAGQMRHARRKARLRMVRSCNRDIVLWGSKLTSKALWSSLTRKQLMYPVNLCCQLLTLPLEYLTSENHVVCGGMACWDGSLSYRSTQWLGFLRLLRFKLFYDGFIQENPIAMRRGKRIKNAEDTYLGAVFAVLTFSLLTRSS